MNIPHSGKVSHNYFINSFSNVDISLRWVANTSLGRENTR